MQYGLNPYFFGKCSTASQDVIYSLLKKGVLILIFLENALRLNMLTFDGELISGLNPYFVGKCSTAAQVVNQTTEVFRLNPYFVGKCSTATCLQRTSFIGGSLNPYFVGKCSTAWE